MSANDMIDEDSFLFAGEQEEADVEELDLSSDCWRILIVDDEPEIHKVSELALANLKVLDRRLEFINAYSGAEALEKLKAEHDIAVILLDVVMETDDAGLKVVEQIREELQMHDVRIILRTGQPGYAPEEQVVIQYDINDYKTKTELTRNKLLTSVYSAVRSYNQLQQISQSKDFLQKLNELNRQLISQPNVYQFAKRLAQSTATLFGATNNNFILLDKPVDNLNEQELGMWMVYGGGTFAEMAGKKYEQVLDGRPIALVSQALKSKKHIFEDNAMVIYIKASSCMAALFLEFDAPPILIEELLQTFTFNIASDLDNSVLLQRVSDIAYVDQLTGLSNRTKFIERLDQFTQNRIDGDTVLLIDIDHFSDINDGLGQDAGNSLLLAVSKRLKQTLPSSVEIFRVGADIFGLIGSASELDTDIILALFVDAFKSGEHTIPINVTIGGCRKLSNDQTGIAVLKHANIALNRAKKDIRHRFKFYKPEMEDETSWRLGMIRRLTSDFKAKKLEVWYQPQINVSTGKPIGMEALLRWPDGQGGYISPAVFIPLAEYSGLIVDIGAWVLEQSCCEIQRLEALSFNDLRVAVNVSMPQFRSASFVDTVIETAKKYQVDPKNLELEITESVVMDDPKLVITALERLKQNDFTIAIDDFGTGFSSLSYLHQLPLDRIKVDREFIKDIGEGDEGVIAETVINLGKKLGLDTIAEGIENQVQLDYIKKLGCDESQGFFHAKPMPSNELEEFLKTHF
jgi:diguanylate cyclase (GGDEF)-like protein